MSGPNLPNLEGVFLTDEVHVNLRDFDAEGYILDIGGGGEGMIGRLKGEKVIAIDKRREELQEAPEGPLKIVMDAKDLQFLDNTFETVTSFFALMYVINTDRENVVREVLRVLKPGGKFLIWDMVIPPKGDNVKEIFGAPIVIKIGNGEVRTGYGVKWEGREQDVQYYLGLAEKVGFEVVEKEEGNPFYLTLRKAKR